VGAQSVQQRTTFPATEFISPAIEEAGFAAAVNCDELFEAVFIPLGSARKLMFAPAQLAGSTWDWLEFPTATIPRQFQLRSTERQLFILGCLPESSFRTTVNRAFLH